MIEIQALGDPNKVVKTKKIAEESIVDWIEFVQSKENSDNHALTRRY